MNSFADPPEHPGVRQIARAVCRPGHPEDRLFHLREQPRSGLFPVVQGGDRADMLRAAGMLRQAPSAGQVSLFTLPSHDDRGAGSRMLSRSRAGRSASDFAQHAAGERTDAADVASNRELMADLAAEGFSAETGDA